MMGEFSGLGLIRNTSKAQEAKQAKARQAGESKPRLN